MGASDKVENISKRLKEGKRKHTIAVKLICDIPKFNPLLELNTKKIVDTLEKLEKVTGLLHESSVELKSALEFFFLLLNSEIQGEIREKIDIHSYVKLLIDTNSLCIKLIDDMVKHSQRMVNQGENELSWLKKQAIYLGLQTYRLRTLKEIYSKFYSYIPGHYKNKGLKKEEINKKSIEAYRKCAKVLLEISKISNIEDKWTYVGYAADNFLSIVGYLHSIQGNKYEIIKNYEYAIKYYKQADKLREEALKFGYTIRLGWRYVHDEVSRLFFRDPEKTGSSVTSEKRKAEIVESELKKFMR